MLTAWLALNLAIGVAALALFLLPRCMPALSARTLPGVHYAAATLVLLVALLAPWFPPGLLDAPAPLPVAIEHDLGPLAAALPAVSDTMSAWMPGLEDPGALWIALSVIAGIGVTASWGRDAWRLWNLRRQAQPVRSHGRVRIWVRDAADSPFSFRGLRYAHVFIPQFVVTRADWYRLAIAHELQHHRQRDTTWLYLFGALRLACALNPFMWLWNSEVARVQELACDESLLGRGRWTVSGYAHGLLEVAQAAAPHRGVAWAPSLLGKRHTLKRRIEEMTKPTKNPLPAPARAALFTGLLAAFTLTAATASSLTGAAAGPGTSKTDGALPMRTGVVAAGFEIPEEGAPRRSHAGIDIVAPAGTAVHAWHEGVVVQAGERKGCGLAVVLQHWQGTRSTYCNLADLQVTAGESVRREQALGKLAELGPAKKAHLHFEIEIDGRKVDPAKQVNLLALK
jgi:beta-lactamase regulating signal transducer with metallopeptidase domain